MLSKKQILFAYPETRMLKFDSIFEHISQQPLIGQKDSLSIAASCGYSQKTVNLTVHARLLQKGSENGPVIIYLPWYGGKSAQSRRYFSGKHHRDWAYIGIDIFNTKEEFGDILASAVVSQRAYALIMRMMAEQVRLAHEAGRRVGIVGISYGANVLSAYTTRGLELPDAIVAVEGGSILQITLKVKYQGRDSDPRTLHALEKEPDLIPVQIPVTGTSASVSAAVINPEDKIVVGQEELWKDAAEKLYIRGTHLTGPLLNRRKILQFIDSHLERLLMSQEPRL